MFNPKPSEYHIAASLMALFLSAKLACFYGLVFNLKLSRIQPLSA